MQWIQAILLKIYRIAQQWGLLETPWFKRIFQFAYFRYKQYIEDPFYALTRKYPELFQNGQILDIGANIGYTSVIFARAIGSKQKVYAFEPDASNFQSLQECIAMQKVQDKVISICAAVGETSGFVDLWHNEQHHADHRIVTTAYESSITYSDTISTVKLYSIDDFVKTQINGESVGFIKIDVQGYELPVCHGMERSLCNNPNLVVAIEYAPENLLELGFDPIDLLNFFKNRGYHLYILNQRGKIILFNIQLIEKIVKQRGYVDLLCSKQKIIQ